MPAERNELLELLRHALDKGEFEVYVQPEYSAVDGRPLGLESLIRWRHPERGIVPPAVFLAICEDSGLILPIGRWVIGEAARYQKRLDQAGWPEVSVSVNISASQFADPGLIDALREAVEAHGLRKGALECEIPEAVVMADPEFSAKVMGAIHEVGVDISIGDFGTGYSSMSALYRVPANRIKIDRSVVRFVPDNAHNTAVCRSIISLAHGKGLQVVAEGVELGEEHEWLKENGCDAVQGYLFARPAPFDDMLRALGPLPG
jgi:EAL domain-containing protein (putative c-di-GMP-specific phosphodiesterase class I)